MGRFQLDGRTVENKGKLILLNKISSSYQLSDEHIKEH